MAMRDVLPRYTLDQEVEDYVIKLELIGFFPYQPFCYLVDLMGFVNDETNMYWQPAINRLSTDELIKWIQLAEKVPDDAHEDIIDSARELIIDFKMILADRYISERTVRF